MSLDAIWKQTPLAKRQARVEQARRSVHERVTARRPEVIRPVARPAVSAMDILGYDPRKWR
jgi:hypothetical protein